MHVHAVRITYYKVSIQLRDLYFAHTYISAMDVFLQTMDRIPNEPLSWLKKRSISTNKIPATVENSATVLTMYAQAPADYWVDRRITGLTESYRSSDHVRKNP